LKKKLQGAIDANREVLISALLPSVAKNPPVRWKRFLGEQPPDREAERMLRSELTHAFGPSDDVFQGMNVKAIFKGVTYESLSDPDFMRIAGEAIPLLDTLHDEFDAAKAEGRRDDKKFSPSAARMAGSGFVGKLLDCLYCLSLWVAAPVAYFVPETRLERLLWWPALSAGAIFLERTTGPRSDDAPALYFEDEEKSNVLLRPEESTTARDA